MPVRYARARSSAWRRPEGDHAGGTGPAGGCLSRGVVMVFADRDDAGRRLAARLGHLRGAAVQVREQAEVDTRAGWYRPARPREPLDGRMAVVVDDGIATGSTARAACQIARALGAARVVLAVPVAPPGWQSRIGEDADEMVCADVPRGFFAIGQYYGRFPQVSDDEVIACLERAATLRSPAQASTVRAAGAADPPGRSEEVEADAGVVQLAGYLTVPEGAPEIVVFVHGTGSSRHSPRNRHVADVLNDAGLGTLLFDLLTPEEELNRANVFDIGLRCGRRPSPAPASRPWSPAAAARIWPAPGWQP